MNIELLAEMLENSRLEDFMFGSLKYITPKMSAELRKK